MKLRHVKIEGHRGTWYNLDEGREYLINGKLTHLFLFEHEQYGEEAPAVIATKEGKPYMENVWNGWDDWKEYVLEAQGYNRSFYPLIIDDVISL